MKTRLSFHLFVILSLLMAALPGQAVQVVAAPLTEGVKPPRLEQASSIMVESLSAGWYHTCGLKSDGTVVCWGNNNYGQSTPPAGTFTQVSAGMYHTCGLKSDGTLACWGRNDHSQSTPLSGTFTQVSAGGSHSCGLRSNGTLTCWGNNAAGQSTPPSGIFTQVSAGDVHTCGLKSDGTLTCWGDNSNSQSTPVPTGTFTQVSAGDWHTCGLRSNGTLVCWGLNSWGQSNPPTGTFTQISAGSGHTCGLKSDGTLACWGDNTHGQSIPPTGTFTQVSSGLYHTCGLKSNGTLACWGAGTTNTGVNPEYGQSIPPGGAIFGRSQISAGYAHTCRLKSDGTLGCWGCVDNDFGQCWAPGGTFTQVSASKDLFHTCGLKGDGTIACWGAGSMDTGNWWDSGQSTPPSGTFTQVSAGELHTCGLKSDGTLTCWGNNVTGQSTPPSGTFVQVSAGNAHTCGLKSDGTLTCWGSNLYGQSTPPSGTFTQIDAGDYHTCGLKSDGTLACWGDNAHGQSIPPTGTFTQVSSGVQFSCGLKSDGTLTCWGASTKFQLHSPLGTFSQVSSGGMHSCGLKSDGTIVCWGNNDYYQSLPFCISGDVLGGVYANFVEFSYYDGFDELAHTYTGHYEFCVPANWSGTVTPHHNGWAFTPVNRSYTNVQTHQTGQDYTGTKVDLVPPYVVSILRSSTNPTNASSVDFTITFSEPVDEVSFYNSDLTITGVTGASVFPDLKYISPDRTTYIETVNTGTGDGTIRLNVNDYDTIRDEAGNPLGGPGAGNGTYTSGETYTVDKTAPTVVSSLRADPSPTRARYVHYTVTFSEAVTGVDVSDFDLLAKGISGASVTNVGCSFRCTNVRTVTVDTGTGVGTLRLLVADDDSILDLAGNPLGGLGADNGKFTGGQSYEIDKTAPTVVSSLRANPNPSNAASVDFTITFSENVTGVDAGDFILNTSGVTGTSITGISGSGTTYTVTVNTGSGNGTIRLDVVDDDTIVDAVGNPLSGGYTGGETYTITKEFSLTIVSANGTVNKNPNQATYHEGDVVQLTAIPNTGWSFTNWTGGLTSSVNPDSVTIHGNTSVTANFSLNTYRIYLPLVIR